MAIDAQTVMKLREMTGLGMMDCKKALTEAEGNIELAIENLRKKGAATAAKRADKEAKEGQISVASANGLTAIFEVNCETDFVGRGDDFLAFNKGIGEALLAGKPATLEAALEIVVPSFGGQTVASKTFELVGKIGEKIGLRRFSLISPVAGQKAFSYVHGTKIGAVVILSSDNAAALDSAAAADLGKDLAMQIAANNPVSVNQSDVPADLAAKEKEIYMAQAKDSGKPEKFWENIVSGRMSKFYKESVLLEQAFIRDPEKSVTDRVNAAGKDAGAAFSVVSFTRFQLGA